MRRIVLLLIFMTVSGMAHAVSWTDLWLTPEQQAQRLLVSGKAADAANKFKDARRRAYAEIEAGQYPEAAQLLESFPDPQSQYNRGNALARAGRLENALAAYDNAIKQTTAESALGRDTRRNRELVAEQLKKQQSSQSKSDADSRADKQQSAAEQSEKQDQRQSGNQPQPGQHNQTPSGQPDQSDAGSKDEKGKSAAQQQSAKESGQSPDQQRQESQSQQASRGEAGGPEDSQRNAATSGSDTEKQEARAQREAADARRDAAAAMTPPEQRNSEGMNGQLSRQADASSDRANTSADTQERPLSEQALSLDQWLRQIPDDPAGLLRRKFLIEHLRRQQAQAESR